MFSFDAKINLETCMEKVILMSKYGTETLRITGHIRPPCRRRSRRRRRVTTYIRTCGGAAPAVLLVLEPFQKYQKKLAVWFKAMFDSRTEGEGLKKEGGCCNRKLSEKIHNILGGIFGTIFAVLLLSFNELQSREEKWGGEEPAKKC